MTRYEPVRKALASGSEPALLCATCPWDLPCVTPPDMTAAEIDAKVTQAAELDGAAMAAARSAGLPVPMPSHFLLTAVVIGDRDTAAQVCPVFALRLKSSTGREIADAVRSLMQSWDDAK